MPDHFDIAIIGAGPAGLSAATRAAERNLTHILFEKGEVGNTVFCYQLKKHVMAEPGKLPLRSPVPFQAATREAVLEGWHAAISKHGVNLRKAEVTAINKTDRGFEIQSSTGVCTANNVILAIGLQGTPRKLGVPGGELPHVAYTLADPDAFQNKDILVVGAGDAAIENALALVDKNRVSLLNRGNDFPLAKDANATQMLKAIDAGKVRCYYSSSMVKVDAGQSVISTPEGELSIKCDHIIARIGAIMPRKFLESTGIKFPSADMSATPVVNHRYESNVPGLFILGALIGYPLIKQAINQGYEVIEHITGNAVEPADQVLIDEKLSHLPGKVLENFERIRAALPLFQPLSEPQYRELIIDSTVHVMEAGTVIFKRNDYTDSCYSVISGKAEIDLPRGGTATVEPGEYFGEIGLLSGRRRTATIKVSEAAWLLETPRKQMLKLISSVEAVKKAINKKFMTNALQTSIFPDVEPKFIAELVERATLRSFKKGEVLFSEGDIGDVLYVVRKGSVKISRKNRLGAVVTQAYLAAGNYVGEMALLSEEPQPRSATVTAAVACDTMLISKQDLHELLTGNPNAKARITEIAEARHIENLTGDWSTQSGDLLDFMLNQGVSDAENVLLIDSDLCIGCDNCESACAATHDGYSRLDRKGGKSFASIQLPVSCRHCENPLCMVDCPPDALTRRANGEVVIQDSCIGCGNCIRNCPYGVIQLIYDKPKSRSLFSLFKDKDQDSGAAKAGKCDMCSSLSSGPACVRSCPTGAAMRVNPKVLIEIVASKQQ